ncbi:gluconate:proton symporter [Vagococcus lutrae]|uniref:gluconate:proton symporter n=1 Tax=Vagococcus lutrae TaxID=81947 RepID=UPI002096E1E1|nr:gluconate:proton symporter [Vagococcus lutrae]MCO7150232.1 gluconate:proton symporter [Vagococcus lutrae]MDT2811949.1 gluconate:proton symporter [Vagococcus lutrae]MDT2818337.1 gluconate:proton symporter [Vagococcus lutrae]MDT2843096.1 gluconate:proton symporter [Vagococcus lutrae]WCG05629.1 gluconate:proton symporter [Vagococcus lutrae]
MEMTIGIILLITYFCLIYFAAKGGNLMIGFFVMAIIWAGLSIVGGELTWADAMLNVFQGGPESWGATAVIVIFGSWFGRILIETDIANTLIKKTVELGGDEPLVTTILLSIVTGLIFTSTFGAGAVVAIGVIILPILMSLGVPKPLAVSSYLMSVGSGMYVNIVLFKQMQAIFTDVAYDWNYLRFGFAAMGVQLAIIIIMLITKLRKKKTYAWAAKASKVEEKQEVPGLALLTPIIPVVLAIVFNWQPIPAFIVASLYALFICGKLPSYSVGSRLITRTFYDGVVDVAPLLGFLFILPMFNKVSGIAAPFFQSIIGGLIPKSALLLCVLFIIVAPLGLFRGPLTVFGAGSATIGILRAIGSFSSPLLFALMYIPTITMNLSACPTQSWNLWALNYSKVSVKEFILTGVPWAWVICILNTVIAYLMLG